MLQIGVRMTVICAVALCMGVMARPAAGRVLYHPEYPSRKDSIKKIMILEPEILVGTVGKSHRVEMDTDKQTRVQHQLVSEIRELLEDKGFEVIYWSLDEKSQAERELYMDVLNEAKSVHGRIAGKAVSFWAAAKGKKVEETLGEKGTELAAMTGADAIAVFRYSIETLSQEAENKEMAKTVLLAAVGIGRVVAKASAFCQLSFYDGTSGELLWYNHGFWQELAQYFSSSEADLTSRFWVLYNLENTIELFPEIDPPKQTRTSKKSKSGGRP